MLLDYGQNEILKVLIFKCLAYFTMKSMVKFDLNNTYSDNVMQLLISETWDRHFKNSIVGCLITPFWGLINCYVPF